MRRNWPKPCTRATFDRAAAIWEISNSGPSISHAEFSSSRASGSSAVKSPLAIACSTSCRNSLIRSSSNVRTSWTQTGFPRSASHRRRRVSSRSLIGAWLIANRRCRCKSAASGCSSAYASLSLPATSTKSAGGGEMPCSTSRRFQVPRSGKARISTASKRFGSSSQSWIASLRSPLRKVRTVSQTFVGFLDGPRVVRCRALPEGGIMVLVEQDAADIV